MTLCLSPRSDAGSERQDWNADGNPPTREPANGIASCGPPLPEQVPHLSAVTRPDGLSAAEPGTGPGAAEPQHGVRPALATPAHRVGQVAREVLCDRYAAVGS